MEFIKPGHISRKTDLKFGCLCDSPGENHIHYVTKIKIYFEAYGVWNLKEFRSF